MSTTMPKATNRRNLVVILVLLVGAAVSFILIGGGSQSREAAKDEIVSNTVDEVIPPSGAAVEVPAADAEDFRLQSHFKRVGVLPVDLIQFTSPCDSNAYEHRSSLQKQLNISVPRSKHLSSQDARAIVLDQVYDGVSPYSDFPSSTFQPLLSEAVKLKGWGSRNAVFARLLKETKPDIVIEVGSFLGSSAIHMAEVSKANGMKPLILCLDDFRGWPAFHKQLTNLRQQHGDVMLLQNFLKNVQAAGYQDIILPVPYSTAHTLTAMCHWGIKADLIEVDAGHDFHSAWIDINLAHRLLKPTGVMFGHDYFSKADKRGVRRAITLFAHLHGYDIEPDGQHWILRAKGSAATGGRAIKQGKKGKGL